MVVGQIYSLTAGVDTTTGTAGNDTFKAVGATFLSALDSIDGGNGTDTLNVVDTEPVNVPANVVVKNVENVNITGAEGVTVNASGWTGLTKLNVTPTGAGVITAATTTTVTVSNSTAAAVDVIGGGGVLTITNGVGTVTANNAAANAFTSAVISGGSTVAIADHSGASAAVGSTLTSVSLSGNTGAATLTGNGITAVTLTKQGSAMYATVVAAAATRTLGLTVNTLTAGTILDSTATTVNVTSTGAANVVTVLSLTANKALTLAGDKALTIGTVTDAAMTALTVSGAALTSIGAFTTTDKLATVTVTGTGGLTADLSTQTVLTSIVATDSSGANTISMDGTKASYAGGSGVDIVTLKVAPTMTIDGGAGTADVLVVNAAAAIVLTKATGFETLGAGALINGATLSGAGFSHLTAGTTVGAVTFSTVAAGTDLTFTASRGAATIYTLATDTATDTLALTLTSAGVLAGDSLTATTVETVNITVTDTDTDAHVDTLTLVDTALTTLKISGNSSLTLTNIDTTVTSVDASGLTKGAFEWTTGILAAASTIKGSLLGSDNINASAAVAAVTITETAGTNIIVGSSTIASTLTGGTGLDTIVGGAGKDTIIGGGGADLIAAGLGADKITVSGSTATVIQSAGASGTNTSTTIQTAELTSTFDVIYGAVAGLKINLGNANIVTGATLVTAGTNLAASAVDNTAVFARGTYDAAAGTFTFAANGLDSAVTYDSDVAGSVTAETIILVGFVSGATTAAAGILTLV